MVAPDKPPCNTCNACCRLTAVTLDGTEQSSRWKTERHPLIPTWRVIAHKPNGDCHYLGDAGCTLTHSDRPRQCQNRDCRTPSAAMVIRMDIVRKGMELAKAEHPAMMTANGGGGGAK